MPLRARVAFVGVILVLVLPGAPAAQDKPEENPQVLAALKQYAERDFANSTQFLQKIGSLKLFQADLDRSANGWLKGSVVPASTARQALAGVALETAIYHLSDPNAAKLIEWACKFVRDDSQAEEFDKRWMRASMAALEGVMQPKVLAAHLDHVKGRIPDETHLALARGVADEQRTAPWFAKEGIAGGDGLDAAESAIKKYREASKVAGVHAEAMLRMGYLQSRLRRNDEAMAALTDAERNTSDRSLIYLSRVFQGQTLERLGKPADALAAYRSALEVVPGAPSATMALAAALATGNQRVEASAAIDRLLMSKEFVDDPWNLYWPADFRYVDSLILQFREVLK